MDMLFSTIFSKRTPVRIGFEDMLDIIRSPVKYVVLNTLGMSEQGCLLRGTLAADQEESVVNQMINDAGNSKTVVVYGRNSADDSVDKKYRQLISHGLTDVLVYSGGLFEWLLLQDIYGDAEFPTTSKTPDLLQYRCLKKL
jgi:hypothetical protein